MTDDVVHVPIDLEPVEGTRLVAPSERTITMKSNFQSIGLVRTVALVVAVLVVSVGLTIPQGSTFSAPADAANACQHGSHNHWHWTHWDYWHYHGWFNDGGTHYHVYHNHRHGQLEFKPC